MFTMHTPYGFHDDDAYTPNYTPRIFALQIPPPWKPDINSDIDTKYIPDEFASEPVHLTPTDTSQLDAAAIDDDDDLPHFEQFSYHGSRGNGLTSYLTGSAT